MRKAVDIVRPLLNVLLAMGGSAFLFALVVVLAEIINHVLS